MISTNLPLRINLYGGAGIGKSTLAARLYADLKQAGVSKLELVQEWIKGWAWENRKPDDYDQVYVFAKQLRAEHRLLKLGVSIITDSPVQMQLAYMKTIPNLETAYVFRHSFLAVANDFDRKYSSSINVLLTRSLAYEEAGRYQNREGAEYMDCVIRNHLKLIKCNYTVCDPTSEIEYDALLELCRKRLTQEN